MYCCYYDYYYYYLFCSIDDLLIARHDPEEILLNLGFGGSPESDVLDRIPSRFLQKQSQARGISTHQFLYQMDELERGCGEDIFIIKNL